MTESYCAGGPEAPERPEGPVVPRVHLALNVRDLEASIAFYAAFFGVPPHKRRPGYANFAPEHLPIKLALNELPPVAEGRTPLNHLGFQVGTAAQVQAARERFAAARLPVYDEGDTVCCFARQDKVWVHDPDGNAWEVYVLTDDMLAEQDRNAAAGAPVHFVPEPGQATAPRRCCDE
ncbi:MAG TPA: ArsI/CadI family heavy metal resistance metalloenzyme [Armatimonadota bacterium]|nr:ArsI/CadI family heavy metal resistance metalloenzyme [Armatimonadota bacterium]